MIFTLTDRHYNPLDSYETDDYLIGRYIGSILETLDLNISLTSLKAEHWVRGNYIMCRDSTGRGYWFTIYDDEDSLNGDDRALSCYSGTIDIVAEECPPFEETVPRSFGWYFSKVFIDTGIQLGINELSGMTRTLKFESKDATNAEMLQFVLNAFDNAEARLDVAFDGSRPTRLILNVFKRLGETVPKVLLSDESDSLTDLDRTGSISELGTSLLCYGAQDDNQKEISLVGKYYEEKDSNGNILYVSPKDSPRIFSVKAHEEYYVQLPGKKTGEFDGYINRSYQSEASTQDSLWNEGLAQLKKIDHAIVDYKASGYVEGCDIGDNVQIAAHRMRPAVMVSARLTTFKFNEDDPERNEYEFTNFVDLESNLDDMSDIINKIKDQIVYVVDQSVEYCLDDQGTTAPETGWSNVNPGAVKGKWLWVRTTINYSNGTSSVSEVPTYSAINGEAGQTPVVHPAWAWSADGTDRFTTGYPRENLWTHSSEYHFNTAGWKQYTGTDDRIKGAGACTVSLKIDAEKEPLNEFKIQFITVNGYQRLEVFNKYIPKNLINSGQRVYLDFFLTSVSEEATNSQLAFYVGTDLAGADVHIYDVKVAKTADHDIYTPAPSEDYANAYPLYEGTYTDYSETASQNPADYTWRRIIGESGQDGVAGADGKDGAQGVPGQKGADGKTSYLHTAWKMADGTFSPEYPNENLWIRSTSVGGYLTTNGLVASPDVFNRVSDYIPVKPGEKYTYQTNVIILTASAQSWDGWCFYDANKAVVGSRQAQIGSTVPVGTPVHTEYTITVPTGASYIRIGSRYLEDGVAKFESGSAPTTYTPAPADDYANAYPKYRGEYTDTIEADSTDPNRYTWTAYLGEQGPPTGVISQSTVPSSPYVGMLWQNTGNIAGYINPATYRWNGSAWEIYQFTAQNILAETFTGFVFQGVKFIGSEFISNYNITKDGKTVEGTLTIGNGNVLNDYSDSNGVVGKFTIDESGAVINQRTLPSGIGEKYELTPYSLALDGEAYRGNVTARQLSQLNAVGDRLWDGAWHMSASQTITPDRPLSSCLTGWLLEFQGYSSNTAQDTDYSYIAVPKSHAVYHSGKPMSPAVTVYGGAITRKILYITDTTIKGHANNAASPASGAVLTAVYAN